MEASGGDLISVIEPSLTKQSQTINQKNRTNNRYNSAKKDSDSTVDINHNLQSRYSQRA